MAVNNMWDERYAGPGYLFGKTPNAFLESQQSLLRPGMNCTAVADGEDVAHHGMSALIDMVARKRDGSLNFKSHG